MDFKNLINPYCLQLSITLPESQKRAICTIVTDEFSDSFSKDHIRKNIDSKYKSSYRVRNGKLKGLRQKFKKIESGFLDTTIETITYSRGNDAN